MSSVCRPTVRQGVGGSQAGARTCKRPLLVTDQTRTSSSLEYRQLCGALLSYTKPFLIKTAFSKHRPSGPMLSIIRFVHMCVCVSVYLCVCVSVCLFAFEVPFNGLFAPTSRSRMSKNFRDSQSLGKSNEKKWSHI